MPSSDPAESNLPARVGDEADVGPYGGFDPSMIIDMDDDEADADATSADAANAGADTETETDTLGVRA